MAIFNQYEAYTPEAQEVLKQTVGPAVRAIFQDLQGKFTNREIGHLIADEVRCREAEAVLRAAMERRHREKKGIQA